jgi:hypothetical protein
MATYNAERTETNSQAVIHPIGTTTVVTTVNLATAKDGAALVAGDVVNLFHIPQNATVVAWAVRVPSLGGSGASTVDIGDTAAEDGWVDGGSVTTSATYGANSGTAPTSVPVKYATASLMKFTLKTVGGSATVAGTLSASITYSTEFAIPGFTAQA